MKKPLADRVIVKPNTSITVSQGGMELPEESVEKPQEGIAVAVGSKCTDVKEGSRVTYGKYAGQILPIEGDENEYLIMRETEILAID